MMGGKQEAIGQKGMWLRMPVQLRSRLLVSSVMTISLVAALVALISIERLVSNADVIRQNDLVNTEQLARDLNILTLRGIDETDAYALGQLDRLDAFIKHAQEFGATITKLRAYATNNVLSAEEIQQIDKIVELRQTYEASALALIDAAVKRRQTPTPQNQALVIQAWQQQNAIGTELNTASQELAAQIENDYQALQIRISQRNSQIIGAVIVIGILVIGIIIAIQSLASRAVGTPIDQLKGGLSAFLAGNQDQRVVVYQRDEIGMLAESCNALMATIQQQTQELQTQIRAAELARRDAEAAHATVAEKLTMIETQQAVINEISVPILPLSERVLTMPLIGALSGERLDQIQTRLLQQAEHSPQDTIFILDITGVPVVDTQVAQGLISAIRAARLIGVEVLLVGIRPEVAQSIVGLGIQLESIVTLSSLQQGIDYAFNRTRVQR